MTEQRTTVAISGGGPAGIVLGLLLARQGVEVTVLEQHADFLRDFRGDTVHPMTQQVLPDLGLTERHGAAHSLRAVLAVAADGRGSVLRKEVGTGVLRLGSPIDVLWFRIDRMEGEPAELRGVIGRGGAVVAINRNDYWQVAFIVAKGTDAEIRAAGLPAFRERLGTIAPWMRARLDLLRDWDDVKLLSVSVERLRRWSAPGILAIGDAAHTMSPIGGVGIHLAVADAVAAANLLGPDLLRTQEDPDRLAKVLNPAIPDRVQRRRQRATALTQRIQVVAQNRVIDLTRTRVGRSLLPPAPVRVPLRGPVARLMPRVFADGIRSERVLR